MTQMTNEQGQQLEAAARSVAVKLQTFHDGLTNDEARVLGLAFSAIAAARAGEDVAGYVYRDWRETGWIDGIGEVRNWCLTWQWNGRGPMPRPPSTV